MKTAQQPKTRTLDHDALCRVVGAKVTATQWRAINAGAQRSGMSLPDLLRSFLLPLFVAPEDIMPFDLRLVTVVDGVVQARYVDQILAAADPSYRLRLHKTVVKVDRKVKARPGPKVRCGRQWPTKAAIEEAISEPHKAGGV